MDKKVYYVARIYRNFTYVNELHKQLRFIKYNKSQHNGYNKIKYLEIWVTEQELICLKLIDNYSFVLEYMISTTIKPKEYSNSIDEMFNETYGTPL